MLEMRKNGVVLRREFLPDVAVESDGVRGEQRCGQRARLKSQRREHGQGYGEGALSQTGQVLHDKNTFCPHARYDIPNAADFQEREAKTGAIEHCVLKFIIQFVMFCMKNEHK